MSPAIKMMAPPKKNYGPLPSSFLLSVQGKYNMVPHEPMLYMYSEQEILFEVIDILSLFVTTASPNSYASGYL